VEADPNDPVKRAEALYNEPLNPEKARQIERLLEQGDARRTAFETIVTLCNYLNRWNGIRGLDLDAAEEQIVEALEIDPDLAAAFYAQGFVYRARGWHDKALASFQRAAELEPGNARAVAQAAAEHLYNGDADKALAEVQRALEIGPDSPARGMFRWIGGRALFFSGRYREAITWLQQSIETWPDLWYTKAYEVSALALIGEKATAEQKLKRFTQQFPDLDTIAAIQDAEKTNPNKHPFVLEGRRQFHQGLSLAEMPWHPATKPPAAHKS
jgi:tetratricopeptide (TPR) repeat protein